MGFLAADFRRGTWMIRVVIVVAGGEYRGVVIGCSLVVVVVVVVGAWVVVVVVVVVVLVLELLMVVDMVVEFLVVLAFKLVLFRRIMNCSIPFRLTICTFLPTFCCSRGDPVGDMEFTTASPLPPDPPLCELWISAALVFKNHSVGFGRHSAETKKGISTAPMITVHTKIKPK